jgi:hypothetical protein
LEERVIKVNAGNALSLSEKNFRVIFHYHASGQEQLTFHNPHHSLQKSVLKALK